MSAVRAMKKMPFSDTSPGKSNFRIVTGSGKWDIVDSKGYNRFLSFMWPCMYIPIPSLCFNKILLDFAFPFVGVEQHHKSTWIQFGHVEKMAISMHFATRVFWACMMHRTPAQGTLLHDPWSCTWCLDWKSLWWPERAYPRRIHVSSLLPVTCIHILYTL